MHGVGSMVTTPVVFVVMDILAYVRHRRIKIIKFI
jgi:hypothetical protein